MSKANKLGIYQIRKTIYRTTHIPNLILPWRIRLSVGKKKNAFFYYLATAYLHCLNKLQTIYKQALILKRFIVFKRKRRSKKKRIRTNIVVPRRAYFQQSFLDLHIEAKDVLDEIMELLFPTENFLNFFNTFINDAFRTVTKSGIYWFDFFSISETEEQTRIFFLFSCTLDTFNMLNSYFSFSNNFIHLRTFTFLYNRYRSRTYLRCLAHKVKKWKRTFHFAFRSPLDVVAVWDNSFSCECYIFSWTSLLFERKIILNELFRYKYRYYKKRRKYAFKIKNTQLPNDYIAIFLNKIFVNKYLIFSFYGTFFRILTSLFFKWSKVAHFVLLLHVDYIKFSLRRLLIISSGKNTSLSTLIHDGSVHSFFFFYKNNLCNLAQLQKSKKAQPHLLSSNNNFFNHTFVYYNFFLRVAFLNCEFSLFIYLNMLFSFFCNSKNTIFFTTSCVFFLKKTHFLQRRFFFNLRTLFYYNIRKIRNKFCKRSDISGSRYVRFIKHNMLFKFNKTVCDIIKFGYVAKRIHTFFVPSYNVLAFFYFFYKRFEFFLSSRVLFTFQQQYRYLFKYKSWRLFKFSFFYTKKRKLKQNNRTFFLSSYIFLNQFFTVSNPCFFFFLRVFFFSDYSLDAYFRYFTSLYLWNNLFLYSFSFIGLSGVISDMLRKLRAFSRRIYSRFYVRRFQPLFIRRSIRAIRTAQTRKFYNLLALNFVKHRRKRIRRARYKYRFGHSSTLRDQLFDNNPRSSVSLRRLQYYYWSLFHIQYHTFLIRNRTIRVAKRQALLPSASESTYLSNLDTLNSISMYLLDSYKMSLAAFYVFSLFLCQANITNSFSGLLLFLESTISFFFFFNFYNFWFVPSSVMANVYSVSNITFFFVGEIINILMPWFRDRWLCLIDVLFSTTFMTSNFINTEVYNVLFLNIIYKLFFAVRINNDVNKNSFNFFLHSFFVYRMSYVKANTFSNEPMWLINSFWLQWFITYIKRLSKLKRVERSISTIGSLFSFVKIHESVSFRFTSLERHFGVTCVKEHTYSYSFIFRFDINYFTSFFFFDVNYRTTSLDWLTELFISSSSTLLNSCFFRLMKHNLNLRFVKPICTMTFFLYRRFSTINSLSITLSVFNFVSVCYSSNVYFYNTSPFFFRLPVFSFCTIYFAFTSVDNKIKEPKCLAHFFNTYFHNTYTYILPKISSVLLYYRRFFFFTVNTVNVFDLSTFFIMQNKKSSFVLRSSHIQATSVNYIGVTCNNSFVFSNGLCFSNINCFPITLSHVDTFFFPDSKHTLSHIFYFFFLLFFKHNIVFSKLQLSHTLSINNKKFFSYLLNSTMFWRIRRLCCFSWPYLLLNVDINSLTFFSDNLKSTYISYKKSLYSIHLLSDKLDLLEMLKPINLRRLRNQINLKLNNNEDDNDTLIKKAKINTKLYNLLLFFSYKIKSLRNIWNKSRFSVFNWIITFLGYRYFFKTKKKHEITVGVARSRLAYFTYKVKRFRSLYFRKYSFLREFGLNYKLLRVVLPKKRSRYSYNKKKLLLDRRVVGRAFSFLKFISFVSLKKYSIWIGTFFSLCKFYFSLFSRAFFLSENWSTYFYRKAPYSINSFMRSRKLLKIRRRKRRRFARRLRKLRIKRRFRMRKRKCMRWLRISNVVRHRHRHRSRVIRKRILKRLFLKIKAKYKKNKKKKKKWLYKTKLKLRRRLHKLHTINKRYRKRYKFLYKLLYKNLFRFSKRAFNMLFNFLSNNVRHLDKRIWADFVMYVFDFAFLIVSSKLFYVIKPYINMSTTRFYRRVLPSIVFKQWMALKHEFLSCLGIFLNINMHFSGNAYTHALNNVSHIGAFFKPHELKFLLFCFFNVSDQKILYFLNTKYYFTDNEHKLVRRKQQRSFISKTNHFTYKKNTNVRTNNIVHFTDKRKYSRLFKPDLNAFYNLRSILFSDVGAMDNETLQKELDKVKVRSNSRIYLRNYTPRKKGKKPANEVSREVDWSIYKNLVKDYNEARERDLNRKRDIERNKERLRNLRKRKQERLESFRKRKRIRLQRLRIKQDSKYIKKSKYTSFFLFTLVRTSLIPDKSNTFSKGTNLIEKLSCVNDKCNKRFLNVRETICNTHFYIKDTSVEKIVRYTTSFNKLRSIFVIALQHDRFKNVYLTRALDYSFFASRVFFLNNWNIINSSITLFLFSFQPIFRLKNKYFSPLSYIKYKRKPLSLRYYKTWYRYLYVPQTHYTNVLFHIKKQKQKRKNNVKHAKCIRASHFSSSTFFYFFRAPMKNRNLFYNKHLLISRVYTSNYVTSNATFFFSKHYTALSGKYYFCVVPFQLKFKLYLHVNVNTTAILYTA